MAKGRKKKGLSPKLGKRLASYSVTAGAALAVGAPAQGSVNYSGVQNIDVSGDYQLDMNNDGIWDISFHLVSYSFAYPPYSAGSTGWGSVFAPDGVFFDPRPYYSYTARYFAASEIIFPDFGGYDAGPQNLHWKRIVHTYSQGSTFSSTWGNFEGTTGYIGVRFTDAGSAVRYGWVFYDHTGLGEGRIGSWAYEETPDAPILAGATEGGPPCLDLDTDGYGDPANADCTFPELDCDDTDSDVNPGASEGPQGDPTCDDGADNDCDTLTDDADPDCTAAVCTDNDSDGYGDPADPSCTHPELDCDDTDPDVNPGASEGPQGDPTCGDGADNDCDTFTDGADPDCAAAVCIDNDSDGYGDPADPSCTHPELDCDDTDPDVNPGEVEADGQGNCDDGADNDCDSLTDAADPDCTTLVELASFDGRAVIGGVKLSWETASEIDNEGFALWRAEGPDGEFVRVTETMISAEGSPVEGASYVWKDEAVALGSTYLYKLEAVDVYGSSIFHGPVEVTTDTQCFLGAALN